MFDRPSCCAPELALSLYSYQTAFDVVSARPLLCRRYSNANGIFLPFVFEQKPIIFTGVLKIPRNVGRSPPPHQFVFCKSNLRLNGQVFKIVHLPHAPQG